MQISNVPDISYVWVTNNNKKIPSTEADHGINNIIATAKKCPNRTINIYFDNTKNNLLEYETTQVLPKNIKFISVKELYKKCLAACDHNRHDPKAIKNAYILYLSEMKYGQPAYAGNFIKLLALYLGGSVSDIGISYNEKTFDPLESTYHSLDRKFVAYQPPVLLNAMQGEQDNVYKGIEAINEHYYTIEDHKKGIDYLCGFYKISIDTSSLDDIDTTTLDGRAKYIIQLSSLTAPFADINPAFNIQDMGYAAAVFQGNIVKNPPNELVFTHKLSHIKKTSAIESRLGQENKKAMSRRTNQYSKDLNSMNLDKKSARKSGSLEYYGQNIKALNIIPRPESR